MATSITQITEALWRAYLQSGRANEELYKQHRLLVEMSHEFSRAVKNKDWEKASEVQTNFFNPHLNTDLVD